MIKLLATYTVCDVLHVADCIKYTTFLGAQDQSVEISKDNLRTKSLEFCYQLEVENERVYISETN